MSQRIDAEPLNGSELADHIMNTYMEKLKPIDAEPINQTSCYEELCYGC